MKPHVLGTQSFRPKSLSPLCSGLKSPVLQAKFTKECGPNSPGRIHRGPNSPWAEFTCIRLGRSTNETNSQLTNERICFIHSKTNMKPHVLGTQSFRPKSLSLLCSGPKSPVLRAEFTVGRIHLYPFTRWCSDYSSHGQLGLGQLGPVQDSSAPILRQLGPGVETARSNDK